MPISVMRGRRESHRVPEDLALMFIYPKEIGKSHYIKEEHYK